MKSISFCIAFMLFCSFFQPTALNADCPNSCYRGDIGHSGFYSPECGPDSSDLETVWMFQARGNASSQPVVDESNIYFGAADDKFYCLEKFTGKKVWDYTIGEKCKNSDGKEIKGVISSPTLFEGKLYFGTICGKVVCLDAKQGSKVWLYDSGSGSFNSPAVLYKKLLMITNFDENVYCFNIDNGSLTKKIPYFMNPPAVDNGKAYIPFFEGVICFDLDKMTEFNKGKIKVSTILLPGHVAAKAGNVYFCSFFSELFCFDGTTGNLNWKNLFMIGTSPCVTNDAVYVDSFLRGLTCTSLSGQTKWEAKSDDMIMGSSVFCNERIYCGGGDYFMCYSNKGKLEFKMDVGGGIMHTIMCSDGYVYFGTTNGRAYCLGVKNAKPRPAKLILTAESDKVGIGMPVKIRADVFDAKGSRMEGIEIAWTVEPREMGAMSPDGTFTAGSKLGMVSVKGCAGSVCDTTELEVVDVSEFIAKITVEPDLATATVDIPIKFMAKATDKKGKPSDQNRFVWAIEPKDAGKIDADGTFIPENTGECKVTASIGKVSGSAAVKVLKVLSISLDPSSALVNFGKSLQFAVTTLDNTGAAYANPQLVWTCDPPELGTVDASGLFTAGNTELEGKVVVAGYGLRTEATVRVEEERWAIIVLENPDLILENIEPGKPASMKMVVRNNGNIPDDIRITTDADWLAISPKQLVVQPKKSVEVSVTVKGSVLKKNATLSGTITVKSSAPEPLSAKVKIAVSPGLDCYQHGDSLDIEHVSRGTTKTSQFIFNFEKPQSGKLVPRVPWIVVSPDTFSNSKAVKFNLTISGSMLPAGESFEGYIDIVGGDLCRDSRIKVTVTTEANINIKLKIGSKAGTINGNAISLAAPPQKIKGSTMVPLRFIGEAFGCRVDWEQATKKITITRGSLAIVLFLDKKEALVNGEERIMAAPPTSIAGKTMVPIRFIAESFGAVVNFDTKTNGIMIEWTPN